MPRDTRTRRLTRPAAGLDTQGGTLTAPVPIVSLLASSARLIDLLPQLHQQAIDRTGGCCSLLFEHNPRNGVLQATSGYGLELLRTEPLTPAAAEADLVADLFAHKTPPLI